MNRKTMEFTEEQNLMLERISRERLDHFREEYRTEDHFQFHLKINKKYYAAALIECPEGKYCRFCGGLNDRFDDMGFWYIRNYYFNEKEYAQACNKCFDGPIGQKHTSIHGVGER